MTKLTGVGALERLGQQFERLEAEGLEGRRTGRTAVLVAVAIVAILVAASLTPPGRAVAGKLGELVGIGDEPTGVGGTSVVIGVGEGPSGERYEIFASTELSPGIPADGATCIGLSIPASKQTIQGASCLTEDQKHALERDIVSPIAAPAPKELGLAGQTVVQGLARGDVASVGLEHSGADGTVTLIPVQFFPLTEELGTEIESEEAVGFFFALVPDELLFAGDERDGPVGNYASEVFSRLRLEVIGTDGATLVDKRYTDLNLPGWWSHVALGPRAGMGFGAIPVEPPAIARKAPPAAD